jgi:hypothetical protein
MERTRHGKRSYWQGKGLQGLFVASDAGSKILRIKGVERVRCAAPRSEVAQRSSAISLRATEKSDPHEDCLSMVQDLACIGGLQDLVDIFDIRIRCNMHSALSYCNSRTRSE